MENLLTESFNQDCHCVNVDKNALANNLANHLQGIDLPAQLLDEHSQLFASSPVFLSQKHIESMQALIHAVETVAQNKNYRHSVLNYRPDMAKHDFGPRSVFFGYDFHLSQDGPKLIEINTNAGGVLLNYYLAMAQESCCPEIDIFWGEKRNFSSIEQELVDMFKEEFHLQFPSGMLRTIAIIDSEPEKQFLHPEFLLFQSLFRRHNIEALIADPKELSIHDKKLYLGDKKIDLVYNRLTDFYLEAKENACLKTAYELGIVALTPSPHAYALFADKRNLPLLSDTHLLAAFGVDKETINILNRTLPFTEIVTKDNADALWIKRAQLFFKPINGYASRGAYRGAKLTHKVWGNIIHANYIAQTLIPPSERVLIIDGKKQALKLDIRCVSYQGSIQQLSARLYQGQTTNLRTTGGGLATVVVTPNTQCC